jgi:glycosyltransferase involved in cell wall biosynthesis
MKLSICIPSIVGREEQFLRLVEEVKRQINEGFEDLVEIVTNVDNKEISIGRKRQLMYEACKGEYAVQIDDDDWINKNYVKKVMTAIESQPDCVGYFEECIMNGVKEMSCMSLYYAEWQTNRMPDERGLTYYRTPFTKTPIRTALCLAVGVKDKRFAEDHDFAKRIRPLLDREEFIYETMYLYSANSLSKSEHNKRYGIK